MNKNINHKVYDSVFIDLFSEKKYLKELYMILIGKNKDTYISDDDITLLDIEKVFINDLYNDLSFVVQDELFILVEAQSTYSKNIVTRLLFYVAKSLEKYIIDNNEGKFFDLYSEKIIEIPKIKLYTIYTGRKKLQDHIIKLSELMVANNVKSDIDMVVNVICREDKYNVLGQYITFCNMLREERKINDDEPELIIKKVIKKCQNQGILTEYLERKKYEVVNMLAHSITTEDWIEHMKKECKNEGIAIGEKRGKIEGMLSLGATDDKIIELTGATIDEIEEVKKNM